jgi:hypothetical protein
LAIFGTRKSLPKKTKYFSFIFIQQVFKDKIKFVVSFQILQSGEHTDAAQKGFSLT